MIENYINDMKFTVSMAGVNRRAIYHMASTVYGEARGEPFMGKVGVAWVILNRAKNPRWWGEDIISVCLHKKQFSCWNKSDPNRNACFNRANYYHDEDYLRDPVFRECFLATLCVLHGIISDPTFGSDHYHANGIPKKPSWAKNEFKTVIIENQTFYNLELNDGNNI